MKHLFIVCAFLLASVILKGQEISEINGHTNVATFEKIGLYRILNGRLVEIATSIPDKSGHFSIRFKLEYEGLYSLGAGNPMNQQGLYRFYFKGNDKLNLKLNKDGYQLTGANSKENEALFRWDTLSKTFRDKGTIPGGSSTYEDFFPEIEQFKNEVVAMGQSIKTGNTKFDHIFPILVDFDFAYYAISYLFMPRTKHPKPEDMTPYYLTFNPDLYLTKQLLDLPYGDRFLRNLVYRKINLATSPSFEKQVSAIPVDVLRGQFVLSRLESVRSYNEFQELNDKYECYFTLPEQIRRVEAVQRELSATRTGIAVFPFRFPDVTGKQIGLGDLKGKIILLDMWATWCGPCRAEEPYWEKLNAEFKDRSVAFVGISTDQDKSKWEAYVADKKLKGIQLHAGNNNPLSNAYKVTGIPRYILIDKSGNLINVDSPRPSDPKLKSLLEEWLKK